MDIAAVATSIKQVETSNSVSIAVARKAMDAQKQQGQAAIELLQAAAQTVPGGANPSGVGERVDVRG